VNILCKNWALISNSEICIFLLECYKASLIWPREVETCSYIDILPKKVVFGGLFLFFLCVVYIVGGPVKLKPWSPGLEHFSRLWTPPPPPNSVSGRTLQHGVRWLVSQLGKGTKIPCVGQDRPVGLPGIWGSPKFLCSRHLEEARLSSLLIGRLSPHPSGS